MHLEGLNGVKSKSGRNLHCGVYISSQLIFSIEINAICGTYEGPASSDEISTIFCYGSVEGKTVKIVIFIFYKVIKGRYLTVQRVSNETSLDPLNFVEMKISSLALDTQWKTVHMKKTKVGFNQECPESHSFAFDWVNFSNLN